MSSEKYDYGSIRWYLTEPWQWIRYAFTGRRSRPRNAQDEFVPLRRHNWVDWDEVAREQEEKTDERA